MSVYFLQQENLRMAVTIDLDVSMSSYIQLSFQYGCRGEEHVWPKENSVLLQYSTNGGVWWSLLHEFHFTPAEKTR